MNWLHVLQLSGSQRLIDHPPRPEARRGKPSPPCRPMCAQKSGEAAAGAMALGTLSKRWQPSFTRFALGDLNGSAPLPDMSGTECSRDFTNLFLFSRDPPFGPHRARLASASEHCVARSTRRRPSDMALGPSNGSAAEFERRSIVAP